MDFFGPREVLMIVIALVIIAMVLDGVRRVKRNRYEKLQMSSRKLQKAAVDGTDDLDELHNAQFPSGGSRVVGIRDDADIQEAEANFRRNANPGDFNFSRQPQQEQFDLDNSIFERERAQLDEINAREAKEQQAQAASSDGNQSEAQQDVLVLHLMASKGEHIQGQALMDAVLSCGFLFGGNKFFDRHINDDGTGEVLFSLANLLNPGTFDLKTMAEMETPGVTLFMIVDQLSDPVAAFDTMVEAVDKLVAELDLNVMDESRSSMTKQTIDHYRQRASMASARREQAGD